MSHALRPHPDFPGPSVLELTVEASRDAERLSLTYVLTGDISALAIPVPAPSVRQDELWRHTCFEAFVGGGEGEGYLELNFAPSTAWAAYRFTAYREGMAPADIAAPIFQVEAAAGQLTLIVAVDLATQADLAHAPWRLALTAVVEDRAGVRSYWSLAHPDGRPDFHHAAGFVLSL